MTEQRGHSSPNDYRDFGRKGDEQYETASSVSSRESEQALSDMKERVESSATWAPDNYSMLALSSGSEIYGHTLPFHGLINIHPKLLVPEAQRIGFAVSAHERVHLHIGGALRREVFKDQPAVDRHFHETVIPLWRARKISIPRGDLGFIMHKEWTSLYEEWDGLRVEFAQAAIALKRYFWLLERGYLKTDDQGNLTHQMNPGNLRYKEFLERQQPVSIEQQFESDPQRYLKMVVTGYDWGNYLFDRQRTQTERDNKIGLWENEEGLANFIGMEISGVSIDELRAGVRQDEGKYYLVDKLRPNYGGDVDGLLASTADYQHFVEVLKAINKT